MSRSIAAVCALVAAWALPANATPAITNFTPASGGAGTAVTINGSGFTGASAVKFAAATSTFQVKSDAKIVATVPATAATGVISVTASGSTAHSATKFTVLPGAGVAPGSGHPSVKITVSGTGFDPAAAVDVFFGTTDLALAVTDSSGKLSIPLQIPAWAQPGTNWVTLLERNTTRAAQKSVIVTTPWTMGGFDSAAAGYNPYENTVSAYNVSSLVNTLSLYGGNLGNPAPFAVSGNIFLGLYDGSVYTYSRAGKLLWTGAAGDNFFHSMAPVVYGGSVFFANDTGDITAFAVNCHLNGAACTPQWTANVGATSGGLTVFNGTLYASSSDGSVHTLNPKTGAEGTPIYVLDTAHGGVVSPIAIQNGSFFYVTNNGSSSSINYSLPGTAGYSGVGTATVSNLAMSSASAFFTTSDGYAHRFGLASWNVQLSTTGSFCATRPVVALSIVFAANCDTLAALDARTGQVRWSASTESAGLAFANGVLYGCEASGGGSSSTILTARDPYSGAVLWSGDRCNVAPEISDGVVYASIAGLYGYALPSSGLAHSPARPNALTLKRNYSLKAQTLPVR